MVKRWTNEINEALNSDNVMVQYHALGMYISNSLYNNVNSMYCNLNCLLKCIIHRFDV